MFTFSSVIWLNQFKNCPKRGDFILATLIEDKKNSISLFRSVFVEWMQSKILCFERIRTVLRKGLDGFQCEGLTRTFYRDELF